MTPLAYLIIILVCIGLSAFFSSSETALLRMTDDQIDRDLKKASKPGMVAARDLIKSSSRLLVTILLGNNIVNILAASCASALAVYYLGEEIGLITATAVMTVVVLIFAEILPKAVAAKNPRFVSYNVALPLYLFHKAIIPFHFLFDKLIDPLINRIAGRSEDEILQSEQILRMAKKISIHKLDGTPLPIIWSAAHAANLTAEHIMTPKSRIFACSKDESPRAVLDQLIEKRFTRVPIYDGSLDKILGTVHLKDLIRLVNADGVDIEEILKDVTRVPERKPILHLLTDLQKNNVHMAIVKDEFGTTLGLLTLEDILEEIVGEIRDEFDMAELNSIKKISENEYEVQGAVLIHDFNRESGWSIEGSLGDTMAGFVFNMLGRPPEPGDFVKINRFNIAVGKVSVGKIASVKVKRGPLENQKEVKL